MRRAVVRGVGPRARQRRCRSPSRCRERSVLVLHGNRVPVLPRRPGTSTEAGWTAGDHAPVQSRLSAAPRGQDLAVRVPLLRRLRRRVAVGRSEAPAPVIDLLGRIGLVGYGVVHLLVAWAALQVAMGEKKVSADAQGAVGTIARTQSEQLRWPPARRACSRSRRGSMVALAVLVLRYLWGRGAGAGNCRASTRNIPTGKERSNDSTASSHAARRGSPAPAPARGPTPRNLSRLPRARLVAPPRRTGRLGVRRSSARNGR